MEDRYVTEKEVSKRIEVSLSKLRNDRHLGRGLPYYKFGNNVRYAARDIKDFMDAHRIETQDK